MKVIIVTTRKLWTFNRHEKSSYKLKFVGLFSKKMKNTARMLEALNKYPEKFQAEPGLGVPRQALDHRERFRQKL